ncbi:MAG: alpha/beta hydrolase family protein [Phycisphaerae bacterium]
MNAPNATGSSPQYSPSLVHQRLIEQAPLKLAFKEGTDFAFWQGEARARLQDLIRMPANDGWDLNVRSLWKRQTELGTIEKIVFTGEPGADIPAYWCVPENATPPYTTFICLQGHSTGMHNSIAVSQEDEQTPIEVAGDRDFGLGCMRRGVAALCIEQRCFGERAERNLDATCQYNTCLDSAAHALMLGRTLVGERILDVDRSIDYLAGRGDVDMDRLGVMGNSGGATVAMYGAALLPRVRAVMPSCSVATYASSLLTLYHCVDNHIPRMMEWMELADVLGIVAPKPIVIVNGEKDEIFPIDGARQTVADLRKIYRAADAEDRLEHVIGPEGHRFYADLAWPKMLSLLDRL